LGRITIRELDQPCEGNAMKTTERKWRLLALAAGTALLSAGPAEAQVGGRGGGQVAGQRGGVAPAGRVHAPFGGYGRRGFYGPGFGYGLTTGGFGYVPGIFGVAPYGGFGFDGIGVAGDFSALGFGTDITGWGSGYGTGWGFGYVNPYIGYGAGYGVYGESPYSLAIGRAEQEAMNESRFNMMNAQAAMAYQAANLYQQEAINEAADRYRQAKVLQPRYQVETGTTRFDRRHPTIQLIPREKLLDADGRVQWPASTPSGPNLSEARNAVDDAIVKVVQEVKERGHASVRNVVAARDALSNFARLALERLRSESPADAAGFQVFLQSLDHVLYTTAENPATAAARTTGGTGLTPDNAPKTAGEVLKEAIRKDETTAPRANGDRPKDAPKPDTPQP
jgi:hypothetical protein